MLKTLEYDAQDIKFYLPDKVLNESISRSGILVNVYYNLNTKKAPVLIKFYCNLKYLDGVILEYIPDIISKLADKFEYAPLKIEDDNINFYTVKTITLIDSVIPYEDFIKKKIFICHFKLKKV
jgi:hypothetical protein